MLKGWMSPKQAKSSGGSWKEPQVNYTYFPIIDALNFSLQPFEIFRAVERKDIMFLMEVRDRAFHVRGKLFSSVLVLINSVSVITSKIWGRYTTRSCNANRRVSSRCPNYPPWRPFEVGEPPRG